MRLFIVVAAVLSLAHWSPGQELPQAHDNDEKAIRQAIFVNIYEARLSVETADPLLQTLEKLSPNLFPAPVRQRVVRDMRSIMVARREWLSQHRQDAQKWWDNELSRLQKHPEFQESPRPYSAPLPVAFQLPGTEKRAALIYAEQIQTEIDWINGRLSGVDSRELIHKYLFSQRLYNELEKKGYGKGGDPRVMEARDNPDLKRQLLRWAIFKNLGAFAGDRTTIELAMRQLNEYSYPKKDREAVLAELPRLINLRKDFLRKILSEFETGKEEVTIAIPEEVQIETKAGRLVTQLRFDAKSKEQLRYELETLGERTDAKATNEARERAILFIQAGYILSDLGWIRNLSPTPSSPGVPPPG